MKNNRGFYLSIVLPSSLAILLFIISIYVFFIPIFEEAVMDDKKEMIAELTNTAWSLIDEFENEYSNSEISLEEAQNLAKERVAKIRYGSEQKDYFWIIDEQPVMIMHPYRPELVGQDLNNYKDAKGKKPFVEATIAVEENQEGIIDYMWQWKDDSTKIVPKLSYVKSFEPWGWIVGTGIYLDDVEEEIRTLKNSLLIISLIILAIIAAILFYVVRQSLLIEMKRQNLTEELKKSKQKYKTLVEASTEGTLMFLDRSIIFSNAKFKELGSFTSEDMSDKKLEELFSTTWDEILDLLKGDVRTVSIESSLICSDGIIKEVILSISRVDYGKTYGYILSIKEVSKKDIADRASDKLSGEIKTSLLLMKQPIKHLIQNTESCSLDYTIQAAANKMERLNIDFLLVKQGENILGIVTNNDISKRAVATNKDLNLPVSSIMTAPLHTLSESAQLNEALLMFSNKKVSHLVTIDNDFAISGVISYKKAISIQHNTLLFLQLEIENANNIDELKQIHERVPAYIHALAESNEHAYDTLVFASSISDKITKKLIEFGIEKYGKAPCKYAFVAMGSEGRKEQTLLTDQDNAIIFEDGNNDNTTKEYFMELANYVSDALNDIGYNYCNGGMMACNEDWCQPLTQWKKYFENWVENPDMKSLVMISTFMDFRFVEGDEELNDQLKEYVLDISKDNIEFLVKLADMTSNFKSPLNAFGNLVSNDSSSKDKTIDLKTILMPVVKYARVLSIKYGIENTNTYERIELLNQSKVLNDEQYKNLYLAYNYLMKLRLRNQSELVQSGQEASNTINITELSDIERSFLKSIFNLINTIASDIVNEVRGK